MSVFWSAAISFLARTLPFRILSYYPFCDRLRFPVWAIGLLISATEAVFMACYGYVISTGGSGRMVDFIFGAVCIVIYCTCIHADKFKLLFFYLFIIAYIMIIRGLASFLELCLFYKPGMTFTSPVSIFFHLTIFAVTVPFILLFLKRTKERMFLTDAPVFWHTVWLVPAFTYAIVFVFTGSFTVAQVMDWRFLLVRLFLLLSMFVVYYILLHSLDTIRRQAALTEQAAQQEQMLSLQRTQYQQLIRHIEETKKARHDLRQHLKLIQAYLDQDDKQALQNYLNAYGETLPPDTSKTFCKDYAVNAVLSYYAEEARKSGIDFIVKLSLPNTLPVSDPEICTLLGNLLENAGDACQGMAKAPPFIRVGGHLEDHHIVLTVDNTCLTEPVMENGRFLSTKHEGYGTGTFSVQSIAKRSGGTAEFAYEDGVFYASVLLYG